MSYVSAIKREMDKLNELSPKLLDFFNEGVAQCSMVYEACHAPKKDLATVKADLSALYQKLYPKLCTQEQEQHLANDARAIKGFNGLKYLCEHLNNKSMPDFNRFKGKDDYRMMGVCLTSLTDEQISLFCSDIASKLSDIYETSLQLKEHAQNLKTALEDAKQQGSCEGTPCKYDDAFDDGDLLCRFIEAIVSENLYYGKDELAVIKLAIELVLLAKFCFGLFSVLRFVERLKADLNPSESLYNNEA